LLNAIYFGAKKLVFYCPFPGCERRFKQKRNCTAHVKTHTPNYECEVCDDTFNFKKSLVAHKKKHLLSEKSLNCDVCGKVCKTPQGLGVHKRFAHNPLSVKRRTKKEKVVPVVG